MSTRAVPGLASPFLQDPVAWQTWAPWDEGTRKLTASFDNVLEFSKDLDLMGGLVKRKTHLRTPTLAPKPSRAVL